MVPLHSSLGNKSKTPSQKKKNCEEVLNGDAKAWLGCGATGALILCRGEQLVVPLSEANYL